MSVNESIQYENFPEGSPGKRIYDSNTLPFTEYLAKYYSQPDLTKWNRWMLKFIEPAFDPKRYPELVKNYGYASLDSHDFKAQEETYVVLKSEKDLDTEMQKFIAFLAGVGFFKRYRLTLHQWLLCKNWNNPYVDEPNERSIDELLKLPQGLNFLKRTLPEMPFWKR